VLGRGRGATSVVYQSAALGRAGAGRARWAAAPASSRRAILGAIIRHRTASRRHRPRRPGRGP